MMVLTRKKPVDIVYDVFFRLGVFGEISKLLLNYLTVLTYHRVNYVAPNSFSMFRRNVSATPEAFGEQLDYIDRRYSVVSLDQVFRWLYRGALLPPRAALITFDDGYEDNFTYAYPALKSRGLPAVVFLATDHIGGDLPFYWDFVAYCFNRTRKLAAHLPLLGICSWTDDGSREDIIFKWVESIKRLPQREKRQLVDSLPSILDVAIPSGAFSGLYLNWNQVREMHQAGIEFGAHTATHPILARIPLVDAKHEIVRSKRAVEDAIGRTVVSFAYPNGHESDFSVEVMRVVREAGIDVAFTLLAGPSRYSTVKKNPLAIRRIAVSRRDSVPRLAAKLAGVSRIFGK